MLRKRRIICIVATSFGLVSASSFISEKTISDIALRNARTLWGELTSAPSLIYYGLDDKPIAYGFVFAKGERFPGYDEIQREVERAKREGNTRKQWGEGRYYRMVVSARRNMPPIPIYGKGLLENYVLAKEFKETAEKILRTKNISPARIYYITPLEKWYGYTDGRDTVYIRLYPPKKVYTSKEFDTVIRRPLLKNLLKIEKPSPTFDKLWQEFERGRTLSLADHLIYREDLVPYYDWSYGCSPTAATMILGYWDNLGNEGLGNPFANFIDYHFQRYSSPEWETDYQVPNLQQELAIAMHTDSTTGGTDIYALGPGIQAVADDNGYGFNVSSLLFGNAGNDWLWNTIVGEVDNNRPFKWGVMVSLTGHSLAGVGYTDSRYVIVHNTWYPPLDYWYYNQWYDGTPADFTTLNAVIPGGSYGYSIRLTSPLGDTFYNSNGSGEVWDGGQTYEITWDGDLGTGYVFLEYSINGGLTWRTITDNTENTGSYFWDIPSYVPTQQARVRIKGYDASDNLMAADGSKGNFTIQGTSVPCMEVEPDTVIFDYSSEEVATEARESIRPLRAKVEVSKLKSLNSLRPKVKSVKNFKPLDPDEVEIIYDDGGAEISWRIITQEPGAIEDDQAGWCMRMTPPSYPFTLTKVKFWFGEVSYDFYLHVYKDEYGTPGSNLLHTPYLIDAMDVPWEDWWIYDVSSENVVIESGDFYVGFCYSYLNTQGGSSVAIGADNTSPFDDRAWVNVGEGWSLFSSYGSEYECDLMVRAIGHIEGGGELVKTMWIKNIGSATLEITGMLPSESWIKRVSPTSFSLVPDDSQAVEVEVDTTGLGNGVYDGYITIHSNDPGKMFYDEPVRLIIGELVYPDISVFPDTLRFEFTSMGEHPRDSKSLVMWVKNEGGRDLTVTDIITHADWITYIQPKHFNVAPSDSQPVVVKVDDYGLSTGPHYAFLFVSSDDPDEDPYFEPVKLLKIGEPDIAVKPDTLSYDLSVGESLTDTIWVSNPGKNDLNVTPQTITPWISSILPGNFTILPDDSLSVEVKIDTAMLVDGLFYGEILFYNNTSTKSPYIEPVKLYKSPGILDRESILPTVFKLRKISPNPGVSLTHIYYDLPHNSQVSLKVYDATGKLVKTLVKTAQESGFKSIEWKGVDNTGQRVPPGIYFIRMVTPEYEGVEKLILYR